MKKEEAIEVLDDMKVKIDIPHAAVMQHKRNEAIDMAISALSDKKGDWINETPHVDGCPIYTCSECGRSNLWESPFCPSCGADMREPIGEKGET